MTGRVIVWPAAKTAELQEFEVPSPLPGEVLVESHYSLLSAGTERAGLLGMPNTYGKFPQSPGYTGSGVVVALGEGVTEVQVGDRVLADHAGHRSHFCKPAAGLSVIPESVSMREAAAVVLAAMSLQGVRKTRLELGESVLVAGLGLLGVFAVQLARLAGGLPVIASDPNESRRKLALELGADFAFDPLSPTFRDDVRAVTRKGRGVDAVVEVSGASVALSQALGVVVPQGRISLLGCTRVSDVPIDFYRDVHRTGVSLIGAHNFVRPRQDSHPGYWTYADDFATLLGLLASGRLRAEPLFGETVSPAEAPRVYQRLAEDPAPPLGILFNWKELS